MSLIALRRGVVSSQRCSSCNRWGGCATKQSVFIQISIKPYNKHRPNLLSLMSTKKGESGYQEINDEEGPDSLFTYYKEKARIVDGYTYLYVSTATAYSGDKQRIITC